MKLYCFYKYNKKLSKEEYRDLKDNDGLLDNEIYPLYAITTDKKLAAEFLHQRKKGMFIPVTKKMDKEDITMFMNAKRSLVLDWYKYDYFPRIEENDSTMKSATIPSTYLEYNNVKTSVDDSFLGLPFNLEFTNPFYFKDSITKALSVLEYDSFVKLHLVSVSESLMFDDRGYNLEKEYKYFSDDDMMPSVPDIVIDELALFVYSYGDTFE